MGVLGAEKGERARSVKKRKILKESIRKRLKGS
jgi:hypothetical protein